MHMETISRSQIKYVSTHPEARKLKPGTPELGGGEAGVAAAPLAFC